jgi:hypothetical protein
MKYSSNSLLCQCVLLILAAVLLPRNVYAQGNFVYTNDEGLFQNTVSGFSVGPDGSLTPVPGSPFATGGTSLGGGTGATNRIAVSTVGPFLFAVNGLSVDVSVFKIDPQTGVLKAVPGSPFAIPNSQIAGDFSVAPTPDGRFLMAPHVDNSFSPGINVFSIGSNGALTPIPGSPFPVSAGGVGLKFTPDGKFLASVGGDTEMFRVSPGGALTSLGVTSGSGEGFGFPFLFGFPLGVDIDCSGSLLYDGRSGALPTTVGGYHIGPDGTLAPLAGFPFQPGVGQDSTGEVVLSPDDKTLFVSNGLSSSVTALHVDEYGGLSLIPGSPFSVPVLSTIQGQTGIAEGMGVSQDGKFLYVLDFPNNLSVFQVSSDGALTNVSNFEFLKGSPAMSLAGFPPKSCFLQVGIAIKPPTQESATINPDASGKIPVAILSTPTFDAVAQVDPASLTFGHNGDEASLAMCSAIGEDVNNDGLADLVCQFNTQQTGLVAGDSIAVLKGKTTTGKAILGDETIRTVPQ